MGRRYAKKKNFKYLGRKFVHKDTKDKRTYNHLEANWKEKVTQLSIPETEALLAKCVKERNKKLFRFVFENGRTTDINAITGEESYLTLASKSFARDIGRYVVENGCEIDYVSGDGMTAMKTYAKAGEITELNFLLAHGANINARGRFGETPLFDAVMDNQLETILFLKKNGAELNIHNEKGKTALMVCANNSHRFDALRLLVELGALTECADREGNTALMHAINIKNKTAFQYLLPRANDVNRKNREGMTALMLASKRGEVDVVRALLSQGADSSLRNKKGQLASEIARACSWQGTAQVLEADLRRKAKDTQETCSL